MAKFGCLLLAAGEASRMGRPKQLLDFDGVPLIRHAALEALAVCAPVVVVCGAVVDPIRHALSGLDVEVAANQHWEQGMGTSIQAGLQRLKAFEVDGLILALGDQPLAGREAYRKLIATQQTSEMPIVSSQYAGTVGVPALFKREFFPALATLGPTQGCKGVIQRNLERCALVDCPDAAADIDTPEDYIQVLTAYRRRRELDDIRHESTGVSWLSSA
jgi:molybdenum cofactor cytidylyltransferase